MGDQQQFTATGKDQYGNTITIPNPQWSTSGGGTLSPSGSSCTYTATTTGNYTITCKEGGTSIEGSATIEIVTLPPELTTIEISPSQSSLHVGDQQQFTATGKDQYGNPVTIPNPQWSTSGGGTLSPSGSSCTYTATTTGNYTITCKENGTSIKGHAQIKVISAPPQLTSIRVTPSFAPLYPGKTQQFKATGEDQYGSTATISDPQWSTSGGGTLAPSGSNCTYTATTTGNYTIICKEDGTSIEGSATVTVQPAVYVSPDAECDGKGPCYSTIQEAIDNAPDGAVIVVGEGTYTGPVVIDPSRSLTILVSEPVFLQ